MKTVTAAQMAGPKTVIQSEVMRRLMDMVGRVARQDAAVLISGETGSGKEIVARAIHQHSQRSGHAFVDVNCAAFPEHLVESELFGYEKGAFSGADAGKQGLFELAEHGTLFLDEIGELDLRVQAKLLRVLDGVPYFRLGGTRKINVDIRLIAATNRDLEGAVGSGKFRGDLYHRIAQFQLKVPPLRERPEDVAAIAQHFLEQSLPACSFTPEAIQTLQEYAWPGNVRELKNVVFNVTMSVKPDSREITPRHLPPAVCASSQNSISPNVGGNLEQMEKQMILGALDQFGGNPEKAAEQLGISARTLRRKIDKYKSDNSSKESSLGSLSTQQQRYFRATIDIPLQIKQGSRVLDARTVNISAGGLAIMSTEELSYSSEMEIMFNLPGCDPIDARAKLAWTSPGGLAGISLIEMHPVLRQELHRWLIGRSRQEGWVEQQVDAGTVEPLNGGRLPKS